MIKVEPAQINLNTRLYSSPIYHIVKKRRLRLSVSVSHTVSGVHRSDQIIPVGIAIHGKALEGVCGSKQSSSEFEHRAYFC